MRCVIPSSCDATILYETVDWHVTTFEFREIHEIVARAGYGNQMEADAELQKRFGIKPYVKYREIVDYPKSWTEIGED